MDKTAGMQRKKFIKWLVGEINRRNGGVAQQAARASGIHFSSFSRWITGQAEPSAANVDKLARWADVDRMFIYGLLGRTEIVSEEQITDDERSALRLYRSVKVHERKQLLSIITAFVAHAEREDES